jgi:hypothetical protein
LHNPIRLGVNYPSNQALLQLWGIRSSAYDDKRRVPKQSMVETMALAVCVGV